MQDLEFTISQYVDGTLPAADRRALEQLLGADAGVQKMLEEHRRLDSAMKSMPMPVVQWEALTRSISSAVDAAYEERVAASYRMPSWIRMAAMPLALAASLLIVAGVGIDIYNSQHAPVGWNHSLPGVDKTSSTVVALQTDKPAGPVVAQIAIGPSAAIKDGPISVNYGQDEAPGESHIMVVSGFSSAHDVVPASTFDSDME